MLVGPSKKPSSDVHKTSPATLAEPESNERFEELMGGQTLPPKGSPRSGAEHDGTSGPGTTAGTTHSRLGDLFVSGSGPPRHSVSSSGNGSSSRGLQPSTPTPTSPPAVTQSDTNAATDANTQQRAANEIAGSTPGSASTAGAHSSAEGGTSPSSMSHQQRASARSWAPKPEEKANLVQSPLQGGPTPKIGNWA